MKLNGNLSFHFLDKMLVSAVSSNIAHQSSKETNVGHDTIVYIVSFCKEQRIKYSMKPLVLVFLLLELRAI